jgi:hypothetical protein
MSELRFKVAFHWRAVVVMPAIHRDKLSSRIQPDDKVFSYLRKLGYSEQRIAGMNINTRLFHDLGAYGDNSLEDIQLLEEEFSVDLTGFEFAKYFPPEFEGRNRFEAFLISCIPFAMRVIRNRRSYAPLNACRALD